MTSISLRLPDELLITVDSNAKQLNISRTTFIKEAVIQMNSKLKQQSRRDRLKMLSHKVSAESIKVNAEFDRIEDDPEA